MTSESLICSVHQPTLFFVSWNDMHCKVYSPWTDFICSFPSVLFLFKEVFGALSVEKGEKYNIMECYPVWKPANRLLFRRQEKVNMMDV